MAVNSCTTVILTEAQTNQNPVGARLWLSQQHGQEVRRAVLLTEAQTNRKRAVVIGPKTAAASNGFV